MTNLTTESRKPCRKCGRMLSLSCFAAERRAPDGHMARCRNCERMRLRDASRDYRRRNPEKIAQFNREYRAKNPDYFKEHWLGWHAANAETLNARRRLKYRDATNDPMIVLAFRIRALLRYGFALTGGRKQASTWKLLGYGPKQLADHLLPQLDEPCVGCGCVFTLVDAQIDHIEPVSRAKNESDVLHLNRLANLRLICAKCNRRKGSKFDG